MPASTPSIRIAILVMVTICAAACSASKDAALQRSPGSSSLAPPPWTVDVVLWPDGSEKASGWRKRASRLKRVYSAKEPKDLLVAFRRDSAVKPEKMWVRVFAWDPGSDEHLGVLLNVPEDVGSVSPADNVAFKFQDYPVAIDRGQGYRRAAFPPMSPTGFANTMIDGLNKYRVGNFGQNTESLRGALALLSRAGALADKTTSADASFFHHFYLGRSHAELSEPGLAVKELREAVRLRPRDPDAHLALLSVYSQLASDASAKPEKSGSWAKSFAEEETRVRLLLAPESPALTELNAIYAQQGNPKSIAGLATYRYKAK